MKIQTPPNPSWWKTPQLNKQGAIIGTPARAAVDAVSLTASNTLIASSSAALAGVVPHPIARLGVALGCGVAGFVAGGTVTGFSVEQLNKRFGLPQTGDEYQGALLGGAFMGACSGLGGALSGAFGCSPGSVAIAAAAGSTLFAGAAILADHR